MITTAFLEIEKIPEVPFECTRKLTVCVTLHRETKLVIKKKKKIKFSCEI